MNIGLVVGCARSGTSILGEIVAAHPDVAYFYEAHEAWEIGGAGANGSHRLTERHATPEVVAGVRRWFESELARRETGAGRPLFAVEKCPRNALRVPYLRAIFPDARLVHIVRDGRDAACSLRPGVGGDRWSHLKPENWRELAALPWAERCARLWVEAVETAEADLGGNRLLVKYEDLVARPASVARAVLEWFGLPDSPEVAAYCANVGNVVRGGYAAGGGSAQWNRDDHAKRVGRWRENLTDEELRVVEAIEGDTLRRLGYAVGEGAA